VTTGGVVRTPNAVAPPQLARWLASVALACTGCAARADVLRLDVGTSAQPDLSTWRREIEDVAASEPALAVGATGAELIASRLDRDQTHARVWRVPAQVSAGLALAPGVVVYGSGAQLVGLASESGGPLWSVPSRETVVLAAAASPDWTALSLAGRQGARSIAVYDRQGHEHLQIEAEAGLGTPALLGTTLLAPFGAGEVAAIDVVTASELGSARLGSGLLDALHTSQGWFFGGPPWVALKPADAPAYTLPRRPLPSRVQSGPESPARGRRDDVTRLYVRPTRTPDSERDDVYMATYGRIAFGMDRQQGALGWVVALPARALAARAVESGFLVCDESGSVRLLEPRSGHVERQWQLVRQRRLTLGEPALSACALDGERVLGADPRAAGSRGGAPPPRLPDPAAGGG
jgi:hypothetical protein